MAPDGPDADIDTITKGYTDVMRIVIEPGNARLEADLAGDVHARTD